MRRRVDVLLVCSSGGHLLQLQALRSAWSGRSVLWVTHDVSDARSLLRGQEAVFVPGRARSRHLPSMLRHLVIAVVLLARARPRVLLTTGASIAVPFAWVGRLLGARVVYVESLTRIEELSLSGRLVRPVASCVYVQWPELAAKVPGSRYAGAVVGDL